MRYKSLIFDFDGTLFNTSKGIIRSARYALDFYGYETPEKDSDLFYFIGPPLLVTFKEHFHTNDEETQNLITKLRERYKSTGIYESEIYKDIPTLLKLLKDDGIKMGIASSKPKAYIDKLLEQNNIKDYFSSICGVSFDNDCETKKSIISRCFNELNTPKEETLVVGDTHFDVDGANENGIDSIGVLWGFGTKEELTTSGARFIANKVMDIESIALGFFEQTDKINEKFNGRIINVHEDDITLVDGTKAKREIVDHNGGVAVVALTENDEVLLVRQFRAPYKETIYEIPAGKLEKGEDPFEAGIRELREECGVTAKNVFSLGKLYPSPGYCGEIIHLYGATELTYGEQDLDEDEFLDVKKVPLDEAINRCMSDEFRDSKTIVGIMKIKEMKLNGNLS